MGMRLNDPLVTSFIYEDTEYEIDLSFDVVLDAFDVLNDKELRGYETAEINLELLIGQSLKGKEAIELWNYIYEEFIHVEEKQIIEYDRKGNPLPVQKERKKALDLDKDAEFIYASFMQAYQMDLFEMQGKLHWNKFRSLLNGLPSNTIMKRIENIRLWEPSKGDPPEYIKAIRESQKIHAIDDDDEGEVDE